MSKLQNKKDIQIVALIFAVTYMVSYITRINYGAVISEMVKDTGFTKSTLSVPLTLSCITYGAGQIVSGICGDKFSPKKLVSYGLIVTTVMNLLIPVCANPYQMIGVWCINGFAQSFMWPPLVKLMTALLSDEDYKKVTAKVTWGSSIGTIAVYLISPALIHLWGWKAVFVFSAVCGIIMLIIWNSCSYVAEVHNTSVGRANREKLRLNSLISVPMAGIMLAIILQGMLRDGVTTWMPSYIAEMYNISNTVSILTGVVLPVFGIVCIQIALKLYLRVFKNPLMCAGIFFAAGTAASLALIIFSGNNAALSVLFSALLTGCMHGANLMFTCMIPPLFAKHGTVSTVSGLLNSCTYIGSAVSTYGIAVLSQKFSWGCTLSAWMLVAAAGMIICMADYSKLPKITAAP